jgi:KamA family protein
LQKYKSRALIVTTSACAMHCRYCFRKNYPYQSSTFENELLLIQQDPTLDEILLSGGDPLSLGDTQLFALLENLEAISHLKRIRIHSRFLIGIPERMHEGFFKKLKSLKKQIIFVIHVNHKNELDDEILQTCQKLLECKIPVLSQTVLLKGVNDNKEALFNLFDTLINYGIIPYYLHQFDPVLGSMHFEVPVSKGLELIQELRKELPGYAVPTYVQEIPGKLSKTPLM